MEEAERTEIQYSYYGSFENEHTQTVAPFFIKVLEVKTRLQACTTYPFHTKTLGLARFT